MDPIEKSKRLAAYKAVDNHVLPEHRVCVSTISPSSEVLTLCRSLVSARVGHLWIAIIQQIDITCRINRPLCRGKDHAAGRGGEQGTGLHPYR